MGHMNKRPFLGACCLATAYIHLVWFLFYFFFFFFFPLLPFFVGVERRLEWSWLHNIHASIMNCTVSSLSILYYTPVYFTLMVVMQNGTVHLDQASFLKPFARWIMMLTYWDCCLSGKQCEYVETLGDRTHKDWNAASELRHQQVFKYVLNLPPCSQHFLCYFFYYFIISAPS